MAKRVSQTGVEVIGKEDDPLIRVTQVAVEVLRSNPPPPPTKARLSQLAIEVARENPASSARLTQIIIEVARLSLPQQSLGLQSWMVFDKTHSFIITCVAGDPPTSAVDELAVLNGANLAMLGKEMIQYRDVTDLGDNLYQISHLLRGRLGTEPFMNSHSIGDQFVMLDEDSVRRASEQISDLNVQRYWKIVGSGLTVFNAPVTPFINTGVSQKPFQVCHLTATRAADDLIIDWVRRSRIGIGRILETAPPIGEDEERYEIDILNGAGGVVRPITGITGPTHTYTSAQQSTDFGSPQAFISLIVYQLSAIAGRGHGNKAVL